MGRKLRFYRVKNGERKQCAARSLKVAIPIAIYNSTPALSLTNLNRRLDHHTLPKGWVNLTEQLQSPTTVVLASISLHPSTSSSDASAATAFTVKINEDLSWMVTLSGKTIDPAECHAMAAAPHTLTCLTDIERLLAILGSSHICDGSPVVEFHDLVELHHGVFKDRTGIIIQSSIVHP